MTPWSLLEYGLTIPAGINQVKNLLPRYLEDAENELTPLTRVLFSELREELVALNGRIGDCEFTPLNYLETPQREI